MPQPLTVDELLAVTPAVCAHIDTHVRPLRTLHPAPGISLAFESRQTLLSTLHAIATTEGITDRAALQAECDVYNALLPKPGLSATLLVQPHQGGSAAAALQELQGLPQGLFLRLGAARRDAQFFQPLTTRQYVHFLLEPSDVRALTDPAVLVTLCIEHAVAGAELALSDSLRRALREDLQ